MSQELNAIIADEAKRLIQFESFETWKKNQPLKPGGLVVVNNSFVFRDVDTTKADDYLAFAVTDTGDLSVPPLIASGIRLNLDFKYLPATNLPITRPLNAAIEDGIMNLGELLFVLIGEIDDRRVLSETVNHGDLDEIIWQPLLEGTVRVEGRRLEVGQVHDEDAVWDGLQRHYQDLGQVVPDGLREAVGIALDKLQQGAVADLKIPEARQLPRSGITDQIVVVLKEQMIQYDAALARLTVSPIDTSAQNEILRLAYSFASDATGYLKLIVSVCDLKPIVLWGTVSYHLALSEAFRKLPWTRSRNKPSMKNYVETISDARNSAFHNLFPFRKSLNVHVTSDALAGAELVIFSEHGRKKENVLSYRDKPLVDVLTGFTRARERCVTTRFWRQNLEVMAEAVRLFEATSRFVKQIRGAE